VSAAAQSLPTEVAETRPPNRSWSEMLKRSFAIDVMTCSACGGQMRLISHIEEPIVITRILGHLGLPQEAPKIYPSRAPPQREFEQEFFEQVSAADPADEFYQPSFDD
jgi:hypothetical protein